MKGFIRRAFALAMVLGFAFTPSLWAMPSGNVPVTGSPVVKSPEVGICSIDAPDSPCNKSPEVPRTGDGNEVGICQVGAGGPCNESPITQPTPDPTTPTPPAPTPTPVEPQPVPGTGNGKDVGICSIDAPNSPCNKKSEPTTPAPSAQPQLKISSCLYNTKTGIASGCGSFNLSSALLSSFQSNPPKPSPTLNKQMSAIAKARGVSSQNIKIMGYMRMGAMDMMKIVFTEEKPQPQTTTIIAEGKESGEHYKTTIVMKDGQPVEAKQVFDNGTTRVYGDLVKQVEVYKNIPGLKQLYASTKGLPVRILGRLTGVSFKSGSKTITVDYNSKYEPTRVKVESNGKVKVYTKVKTLGWGDAAPTPAILAARKKAREALLAQGYISAGVYYEPYHATEFFVM